MSETSMQAKDALGISVKQKFAAGKALRDKVPRTTHAKWKPAPKRPDPIELIRETDCGRLEELLPIRYARMRQSPFSFYRGTAALMACDLAETPATEICVQACGDCHVANFGGFGSPERQLVFDINDFDETLPAPWEWDVKRMAASIVLAGRELGLREKECKDATRAALRSYRERTREYAEMTSLDVWYSRIGASVLSKHARDAASRKYWKHVEDEARRETSEHVFVRITKLKHGKPRIIDTPPLVYHPPAILRIGKHVREMFKRYRHTLPDERRVILDRYEIVDLARKVVGVGSVGTRCAVALLMAGAKDALFLQFKEARRSALEPYAGKSHYENQGERVVTGQRMLQAASDVFLGWTRDDEGHDYYFRQLRDMRMKVEIETMTRQEFVEYVELCGWTLARAHARTGRPAVIAGYLGNGPRFDEAVETFAVAYADQTEKDFGEFVKAMRMKKFSRR